MKKCPYCAEEIQDEAIICRWCGSNLESVSPKNDVDIIGQKNQEKEIIQNVEKKNKIISKSSIWMRGLIFAGVMIVIHIVAYFYKPSGFDIYGKIFITFPSLFVFYTIFGAIFAWLWRKRYGKLLAILYCLVSCSSCLLLLVITNAW